MSFRYIDIRDVAPALQLKELLTREKVRFLRPGEHPLADGFNALDHMLTGRGELSHLERRALTNLLLDARMLFGLEAQWSSDRDLLVKDLLTASEYVAIAFELEVMTFTLDGVAKDMRWERYRRSRNDVYLSEPDLVVECVCQRRFDEDSFFDAIREKARQRRTEGYPCIIAVGFAQTFEGSQAAMAANVVRAKALQPGGQWQAWFQTHPHVSGALVFLPRRPAPEPVVRMQRRMREVRVGQWVEIRNNLATHPLPPGFAFRH